MSAPAPAPGGLTISSGSEDGAPSIVLVGELDLSGAGQMEASLAEAERALARGGERARLLIDLSRLTFLDSTGLRLLLQADMRAREGGYELVLRRGGPSVQRVFEVTGALDVLRFEDPAGA